MPHRRPQKDDLRGRGSVVCGEEGGCERGAGEGDEEDSEEEREEEGDEEGDEDGGEEGGVAGVAAVGNIRDVFVAVVATFVSSVRFFVVVVAIAIIVGPFVVLRLGSVVAWERSWTNTKAFAASKSFPSKPSAAKLESF